MDKIEELIKYHPESEYLDFKQQEYKEAVKPHLLKDVLAFANAAFEGDRYIIIGIKKDQHGPVAYNIENPFDSANVQQYILANITPPLDILYTSYDYEGKTLMILIIQTPKNQPYLIKKTVNIKEKVFLKEGEMWIRKGSHQLPVSREDLDRIYLQKQESESPEGKINVTFEDGTTNFNLVCVRDLNLPSDREKKELEESIRKKEELLKENPDGLDDANIRSLQSGGKITLNDIADIETLKGRINDVKMNFQDEDKYYLYEQRASRINLIITNNGQANLEDVLLELRIPIKKGIIIPNQIVKNTPSIVVVTGMFKSDRTYPKVTSEMQDVIVREEYSSIRHQMPIKSFKEPLRIFVDEELAGQQLKFIVIIHGKNLKKPQRFELTFSFS